MKTKTTILSLSVFCYLFAALNIVLQSCTKATSDNEEVLTIRLPNEKSLWTELCFDSIFVYDQYVILEANDESIIRHIDKLYDTADKFFILDSFKRILIFDKQGGFIRTIDHNGAGPNEYVKLQDFDLNGDTLYLLDSYAGRILMYSSEDKFIGHIDAEKAKGFIKLGDDSFAYNIGFGFSDGGKRKDYSYSFVSPEGNKYALEFNSAMLGRQYSHSGALPFYRPNLGVYHMVLPFNETIYALDKDDPMPTSLVKIIIDGEKREIDVRTSQREVESILKSDVTKEFFSLYRWDDDLFLGYETSDAPFVYSIIDISNGHIKLNQAFRLDKNGFPIMPYSYITDLQGSQKLLSVVDPNAIRSIARAKGEAVSVKLNEVNSMIDEDSNPILLFYEYCGVRE